METPFLLCQSGTGRTGSYGYLKWLDGPSQSHHSCSARATASIYSQHRYLPALDKGKSSAGKEERQPLRRRHPPWPRTDGWSLDGTGRCRHKSDFRRLNSESGISLLSRRACSQEGARVPGRLAELLSLRIWGWHQPGKPRKRILPEVVVHHQTQHSPVVMWLGWCVRGWRHTFYSSKESWRLSDYSTMKGGHSELKHNRCSISTAPEGNKDKHQTFGLEGCSDKWYPPPCRLILPSWSLVRAGRVCWSRWTNSVICRSIFLVVLQAFLTQPDS